MSFVDYTPTPTQLETLSEADDQEPLEAATTNVSLEQLADGVAWLDANKLTAPGNVVPDDIRFDGVVYIANRSRRRARVTLSDADHTIDTAGGDCFMLPTSPASPRIITLRQSTAPVPMVGELIEIVVFPTLAPGIQYNIRREGSGFNICQFYGNSPVAFSGISAQFEFSGGVWRLGLNSGWCQTDSAGVLPGPHA